MIFAYLAVHFSNVGMRVLSAIVLTLCGSVLLTGLSYPVSESVVSTYSYAADNLTVSSIQETKTYAYDQFDPYYVRGLAVVMILTGVMLWLFRPIEDDSGGGLLDGRA